MKYLFLIISIIFIPLGLSAGILNNSGTTAEDSLTIPFYALDSTGNLVAMTTGDSVFLRVYYPSGSLSFEDSAAFNGSLITSTTRHGLTTYSWKEAIADIDGTPRDGLYSYQLIVHDKTIADLWTPHQGEFQLYQTENFSVQLDRLSDSLQGVIDSLQSQYTWVAHQMDIYDTISRLITDSSVAQTGVNRTWDLEKLHIRATGNDTALVLYGSGSGFGAMFRGGLSGGIGASFRGFGTNGYGLAAYSDDSYGTFFASNADSSYALYIRGTGGAGGMFISSEDSVTTSETTKGVYIKSKHSDALQIWGGTGQGRHAIEIRSPYDPVANTQDAVRIFAEGTNARGVRVTSDLSYGAEYNGMDTAFLVTGSIADIVADIHGIVTPTDTNLFGEIVARLSDSNSFKGSGGTLDSSTIARSVWNTPATNHIVPGTFGKYLDTEVSGIGSGSGAFSVSIISFDSSANQTVNNVAIAVRNISQSGLIAVGRTDPSGVTNMNLDAASYLITAIAPGYIFNAFDTLIISGAATDTIMGYSFDPGNPASANLTRLYGFLYDLSGDAEVGAVVTAILPKGVTRSGSIIVSPFPVSTITDGSGYFYLDLIPSDSLIGDDSRYEITINRADGTIMRKRLLIPVSASWQLTW